MRIRQKSFNYFVQQVSNFDFLLKYSDRVSYLNNKPVEFTSLPYDVIKHEIPNLIEQNKFQETLNLVVGEKAKGDNYKKLKFLFWILDQYKIIAELENKYLASPPDPKLVAAGINQLDILGDINVIDALAQGDVLKWEEIRRLPYSTVFDKQLKTSIESRISQALDKNTSKK